MNTICPVLRWQSFDTPQPKGMRILESTRRLALTGLQRAKVAVASPQALLASRSHCVAGVSPHPHYVGAPKPPVVASGVAKVPVCPTVLNPRLRIFLAAFSSRSRTHPQAQTWVRVDNVFFTMLEQLEHSWLVPFGVTAIVIFPNTLAKYSSQTLNIYQDASLIDFARLWFLTIFLILKSS